MNSTDNQLTIGLNLGDRRHTVCVLNAGGDIVTEEVIVNTRECLAAFAARFPGATIVMETGTHSPWGPLFSRSNLDSSLHRAAD